MVMGLEDTVIYLSRCATWVETLHRELVARKTEAAKGKKFATASARYNAMTGPAWECADVPDNAYGDGAIADTAIEMLRQAKDKPFFLAVGFLKPHLPFVAPKKYWDLYRRDQIPLAANPFAPSNAPKLALADCGELRAYHDVPRVGPVTEEQARSLKHGYYAAVSYFDCSLTLTTFKSFGIQSFLALCFEERRSRWNGDLKFDWRNFWRMRFLIPGYRRGCWTVWNALSSPLRRD